MRIAFPRQIRSYFDSCQRNQHGASAHTGAESHSHSKAFMGGFAHPCSAWTTWPPWWPWACGAPWPPAAPGTLLWGPVGFAAMLLVGAMLGLRGVACLRWSR